MPRAKSVELTERQCEVLRLIAAGRSNTEIGEALGISLDGAKWHVSEILSKLDVSTREEAAEYWRARQGLGSRTLRVLRSLVPGVGWLKVGGAVAAVAGVSVAVVAGIILNRDGSDGSTSTDAAMRVEGSLNAVIVFAQPDPADPLHLARQIYVADGPGKPVRTIGPRDNYQYLALSPDGKTVAAIAGPADAGQQPRLRLIDVASGHDATLTLSAQDLLGAAAWSPDSRQVALTGSALFVVNRDGSVVAAVQAPRQGGPTSIEVANGGASWSPDGTRFATLVNGELLVAGGQGATSMPFGFFSDNHPTPYLAGWTVKGEAAVTLGNETLIIPLQGSALGPGRAVSQSDTIVSTLIAPAWKPTAPDGTYVVGIRVVAGRAYALLLTSRATPKATLLRVDAIDASMSVSNVSTDMRSGLFDAAIPR
jgi:DNA-binding CsgD family transcriptional regulator